MDDSDALTLLCVRFLGGDCSPEEVAMLGQRLILDPGARALYRDVCRQATSVRESASARQQAVRVVAAGRRRAAFSVVAAAASVLLVATVGLMRSRPTAGSPAPSAAVAVERTGTLFFYPFEGFPTLELPSEISSPLDPLRVPAVGEPEPRIVSIARHLNGLPPVPTLDL